ncbi:hypothetical protein AN958_08449 [Leucoagaricus sp. SymC.cos]|nr:hypothetical protein AN958_08449 [Leucoagaricus sp. SymC.cos]
MDYLCHHCYTHTAIASVKDSMVRHLNADGDEILQPKMSDSTTSSHPSKVNVDRSSMTCSHSQGTDSGADVDTDMDATEDKDGDGIEDDRDQDKDLGHTPPHTATAATSGSDDDPHVSKSIQQGQKLYAFLEQIHNPAEQELYAQELVNMGALLAYLQPESSPLAQYLSIESVHILVQTSQSPTSKIENTTRYTTVLWVLANEMKIKARPGMVLPPVNPTQRTPTPPMQTKQVPEGDQV